MSFPVTLRNNGLGSGSTGRQVSGATAPCGQETTKLAPIDHGVMPFPHRKAAGPGISPALPRRFQQRLRHLPRRVVESIVVRMPESSRAREGACLLLDHRIDPGQCNVRKSARRIRASMPIASSSTPVCLFRFRLVAVVVLQVAWPALPGQFETIVIIHVPFCFPRNAA